MNNKIVRAADHLVDLLQIHGVKNIFGVPGESFLPVLDALYNKPKGPRFITFRQEGGAAMAADAEGKLSNCPGICMVTRGPGASNASAGLHIAFQDSTPMILFIGQAARNMIDREAFQEIDYRRMFGQMAKWVAEINDASRLQEYIGRAFQSALSGRPGPVVLSLPEDMLYEKIIAPPHPKLAEAPRFTPATSELDQLKTLLKHAKNPLVIAGGSCWTENAISNLQIFAKNQNLPIAVSLRSQSLYRNDHPNYIGHFGIGAAPFLVKALKQTDLLIALGPRLGEMTTGGYELLKPPKTAQKLIHIFPCGEEIGRVYEADLALVSDMQSFCNEVASWEKVTDNASPRVKELHHEYLDFSSSTKLPKDNLAPLFEHLSKSTPDDAIICNGAGNYAAWLHRFYKYLNPNTQLAPTSGSMGYGLPAAISAALNESEREVYAIAGDGCFMMTCQEMATAVQYQLNLNIIIVNNNRLGTIRAHQEREFPNRPLATDLTNPDFCEFAKSFGASADRVFNLEEFDKTLSNAQKNKGVNLIEIIQDPALLAPGKWMKA